MKKHERHHGKHVLADFIWDTSVEKIDDEDFAKTIFQIMENSISDTNLTVVHKKLCILGNDKSPPGFTSIILIDESHISSHCYSDRGWLAIDVFTCGLTNPELVMENIVTNIRINYPSLICTNKKTETRFHY